MTEERYENVSDLPETLQEILPDEAKSIYLDEYQDSWDNYEELAVGEMDRSSVAHRNAMEAVYQEWVHDEESGKWHKRGEETEPEEEGEGIIDEIGDSIEDSIDKAKKSLL